MKNFLLRCLVVLSKVTGDKKSLKTISKLLIQNRLRLLQVLLLKVKGLMRIKRLLALKRLGKIRKMDQIEILVVKLKVSHKESKLKTNKTLNQKEQFK